MCDLGTFPKMRNLILLIYSLQIIFAISNSLAIERNEGQPINEYGPAEVYIDQPLDQEEQEFANKQVNRLPLEEDENARFKRSLKKYKVLESPGLHSHFQIVQDEEILKVNPHRRRYRRSTDKISKSELHSDEVEDLDNVDMTKSKNEGSDFSIESVPNPQKQVSNPAHYRSDDSRTMDKWVKAPYGDFQSRARKEEEDSHGESSSNVGIKTRTPRVNFITQQGQSSGSGNKDDIPDGPEARERERERERERDRDQQNNSNNNNNNNNNNNKYDSNKYDNKQGNSDDSYRKPPNDRYYPPSYNKYDTYDRPSHYPPQYPSPYPPNYYNRDYPPTSQYNPYYDKYNPYDRYYDRYNERNGMMPPPGMQRMTPPVGPSSSIYYRHQYNEYDDYVPRSVPNYYYSDKRFEMPMESREPFDPYRPYLYNNEVSKPGRIVYYANLPDVVRTPNNYRYASARYADSVPNYRDPNYYYDRDDYAARTAKSVNYRDVPASTTMRVSSTPVRSGTVRDASYYG
ncbi:unnamed protein product [Chironomus riparius]|uniref:Uncharacterized protein n=1 Tax=Chironomus riparius TaxID=315576 RepID=A0A9P0NLD4_9DIPT|nr:unnamed protein product [Chironomus riparius]